MVRLRGILPRIRRTIDAIYTERDLFRPYELLLVISGFHLPPSVRGTPMRIFFTLTRIIQLVQYGMWVDRFALALADVSANPRKAMHYGNTFGVLSMMNLRLFVNLWYLPDVERLMAYLRRQRTRWTCRNERRQSYRKVVNIALIFQLIGLADRLVYCFSSTYRHELYEMPANIVHLGSWAVFGAHMVTFDFGWRWAAAYNTSLTGISTIMMGLYDELSDISSEYGRLLELGNGSGTGSGEFWAQLEGNITRAVRRYETFLWQIGRLKPFLKTTFLVMFYSAVLFLALGTFMISANGTTTYDIILSGFLCALLLECYWCCRLVDRLNDMNKHIGLLLYSIEWPTELRYSALTVGRYRQVRTSLLIMMNVTQKNLGITCGGMFEMSSEAFTSLMKMTYTMLMFLRDTQNDAPSVSGLEPE